MTLTPGHGRGILCLSLHQSLLATGSQDHSLRVYDLSSFKHVKELYTKRYGHTEWVTSASFLPDGRILSAGMDN
jgi:WD40 repeat protein